jgi:hypothetical protein
MTMNPSPSTLNSSALPDPMEWLFGQLHGMFGNRLLDGFRSGHVVDGRDSGIENMKRVWADKIRSNRLKFSDVRRGLAGAERLKWPPSWGEFLELCMPHLDIDEALREAVAQMTARQRGTDEWSRPEVYWAAVKVGEFDMLSLPHAQLKPRFASALAKVLEDGEVLPVPRRAPALMAPGKSESTREHGRQQLAALKVGPALHATATGGSRDWAHRIIAEHELGAIVPPHKLGAAREAIRS